MNKSIFPNALTAANLAFGVIGIAFAAKGLATYAAICVILSLVADGLDGRVARALGVSGPMGRELDSLSDVVGFGVAPAFMLFAKELGDLSWLGYVPLILFACLGARPSYSSSRLLCSNLCLVGGNGATMASHDFDDHRGLPHGVQC